MSSENIDPKDIELLKDIDPRELKDLGLKDIELEGLQGDRWAEIISSFQQALLEQNGLASNNNSQLHTCVHHNFQETTKGRNEVEDAVSSSTEESTQQLSSPEFKPRPLREELSKPQYENSHVSPNTDNRRRQDDSTQVDWATNGTAYQQELQYSTDDGSLPFSALDGIDGAKLLEIQNAIQEFGGNGENGAFEQLLREINKDQPTPAAETTEHTAKTFSTQLAFNLDDRPVSMHSEPADVNVDQIPQEVVSASIGRLLETSNFNISSLSQATQEQLMWLVNQLNQRQHPQDEYGDEGDEGDDDKSKSTPPLWIAV